MEHEEFDVPATDEAFRRAVLTEFKGIRQRFDTVDTRLSEQDDAIAKNTALTLSVADGTKSVREFMNDGASAARFFCRLAAAWRFGLRWVALPICLPIGGIYAAAYYDAHGHFPGWLMVAAKALGL